MIKRAHRQQPLWFAFMLHRLSGLALALFLPIHFYVLSLTLTNPEALDQFLTWTAQPLVKGGEFILVFLLAVHLLGGLRLLTLEFLPWQARQKTLAAVAVSLAFILGMMYLLKNV